MFPLKRPLSKNSTRSKVPRSSCICCNVGECSLAKCASARTRRKRSCPSASTNVFADVTEDMKCFHEEIFGPAVTIVKAKDFDHALHLANASPYGLSSAIYTNDRLEAYRYKTGIKAGMTGINNSTTGAEAHLPFGGVKGSGNGTRESGIWVIDTKARKLRQIEFRDKIAQILFIECKTTQ